MLSQALTSTCSLLFVSSGYKCTFLTVLLINFNGWELLPAAPLQPCAKVLSGRGHLLLWTALLCYSGLNLVPGHYSSNNVYFAVQAWLAPST